MTHEITWFFLNNSGGILKLLACWTGICPAFANTVDPDQLASSEDNWSGSALFVIKYVNLYQQPGLIWLAEN